MAQGGVRRDELEDALLSGDLFLLPENGGKKSVAQFGVLFDQPPQNVFRLGDRHALEGHHETFDHVLVQARWPSSDMTRPLISASSGNIDMTM